MIAREVRRWPALCGVLLFAGVALGRLAQKPAAVGESMAIATASTPVTGGLASDRAVEALARRRDVPLVESLSARHAGEDRDLAWGDDAKSLLKTSLPSKGTTLSEPDCRRTLCKLDVVHDTPSSAQAFQKLVADPSTRPWDGEVFLAPTDPETTGGSRHVVMFISRKGSALKPN